MKKLKVLAYDLGGTKVHVAVVDDKGRILEEVRVPVQVEKGKTVVIQQLADLGKNFVRKHSEIKHVGIAAPGPLISSKGLLLDPTNLSDPKSKKKSWGQVHITKLLSQKLRLPVTLENDAAAAMLAEKWKGKAKGYKNSMILTLGTGLGAGVIVNDQLVRAGRGLHPEAGHTIIGGNDESALCGCGNKGCAEGYLSGRSFERRNQRRFGKKLLSAKEIDQLARKGHRQAIEAFNDYADFMAIAINNYVSLYSPEIVVLTGSFANSASLFVPRTKLNLKKHLERRRVGVDLLPAIEVSSLKNSAGVLGGAYVALEQLRAKL